jgi:hypothetical protein
MTNTDQTMMTFSKRKNVLVVDHQLAGAMAGTDSVKASTVRN